MQGRGGAKHLPASEVPMWCTIILLVMVGSTVCNALESEQGTGTGNGLFKVEVVLSRALLRSIGMLMLKLEGLHKGEV
jgi:hypothetical protein